MELRYQKLRIRNALKEDCEQLAAWWNDGSVMAHAGFPLGLGISPLEVYEKISMDDEARRHLILEHDGLPIGELYYYQQNEKAVEIGIKICQADYQEKGLGRIALSMLIEELFSMGAKVILLDTNLTNARAQHVYELLGFIKVAVHNDSFSDQLGKLQSSVDYELRKADFVSAIMDKEESVLSDMKNYVISPCI